MTPDADARTQFRQAIAGRNLQLADRAARRAPLTLDQAVDYVLLLAERGDPRLARARQRLLSRIRERGADDAELRAASRLLELVEHDPDDARDGLMAICRRR